MYVSKKNVRDGSRAVATVFSTNLNPTIATSLSRVIVPNLLMRPLHTVRLEMSMDLPGMAFPVVRSKLTNGTDPLPMMDITKEMILTIVMTLTIVMDLVQA